MEDAVQIHKDVHGNPAVFCHGRSEVYSWGGSGTDTVLATE